MIQMARKDFIIKFAGQFPSFPGIPSFAPSPAPASPSVQQSIAGTMTASPIITKKSSIISIDGVEFKKDPSRGKKMSMPYPRDGMPAFSQHLESSKIVCSIKGIDKSQCEKYGRTINEQVDNDLACRWQEFGTTFMNARKSANLVQPSKIFTRSMKRVVKFSTSTPPSNPRCVPHELRAGETVDSIFKALPPVPSSQYFYTTPGALPPSSPATIQQRLPVTPVPTQAQPAEVQPEGQPLETKEAIPAEVPAEVVPVEETPVEEVAPEEEAAPVEETAIEEAPEEESTTEETAPAETSTEYSSDYSE